jgi:hypothetical protein
MALAQTELPELQRFNFFVSRRFEEGRERFRLHMGYFATLAEAEEWLNVVREIYPGAWAGEAPGRKLRERAAAANAALAQHAAGPPPHGAQTTARTATRVTMPAPRAPQPGPPPSVRVPVVHAAPQAAMRAAPRPAPAAPPAVRPGPQASSAARHFPPPQPGTRIAPPPAPGARRAPPVARVAARGAPLSAPAARAAVPAQPSVPARPAAPARPAGAVGRPRPSAAVRPQTPAPAATRASAAARAPAKPAFQDSNVREVLAALGETSATGETRLMHLPPPPRNAAPAEGALSDTQVLRVLEERAPEADRHRNGQASSIPLLKPDDTGTRKALKDAVARNAPVWFVVQLQWSVQPVELERVPPLAIFSAYTLYTVEGSREGRRWYGLRLGFFSDVISAKQVAYYVRSEFGSVAVVPVSPEERARATDDEKAAAVLAAPEAAPRADVEEFKLTDVREEPLPPTPRTPASRPAAKKAAAPAGAARPRTARGAGRVGIRERRGGPTLEETLEILGASELTIEDGSGEVVNDTGVRHLRVEVQRNSPFSRLLERLSERVKKS